MEIIEIIKAIFFGIVEGITEWLPISSTGHMILLDKFVKLNVSEDFWSVFLVVIQLGAIIAVVIMYFGEIFPFGVTSGEKKKIFVKKDIFSMWFKILVGCVPAAIIGVLFDEIIDKYLYNYITVALALIVFGVLFIIVEKRNQTRTSKIDSMDKITYKDALIVGVFQLIAAIFPGTSRSGSTILGGIFIGIDRVIIAKFTFYMAIPVMFGASLLKLLKFGLIFTSFELVILTSGLVFAFITSIIVIKFLMNYIKKHDFVVFGYYRIVLGILVLLYFMIS